MSGVSIRFCQDVLHGGARPGRRVSVQPIPLDTRIRGAVRARIAEEVARLIGVLDGLDADAELEEHGDEEPNLGWVGHGAGPNRNDSQDDREADVGDEGEPDEDREPALGWTEAEDQAGRDRFGDRWRWDEDEA